MKYLFYAIVFDVAGNTTAVGSSTSPAKTITTNIQKVTGISINPSSAQTKNIGDTFKITATVSPIDANNKSITWSSSNSGIATVDSSGNVRCVSAGTTTITATASDGSGKSASLLLTVYAKVTITAFSYSSTSINVGQVTAAPTKTITGTAKSGPTYSSSNTSVATVASDGKVTGKTAGTATITISYTNYDGTTASKTCSITVKSSEVSIISWASKKGSALATGGCNYYRLQIVFSEAITGYSGGEGDNINIGNAYSLKSSLNEFAKDTGTHQMYFNGNTAYVGYNSSTVTYYYSFDFSGNRRIIVKGVRSGSGSDYPFIEVTIIKTTTT